LSQHRLRGKQFTVGPPDGVSNKNDGIDVSDWPHEKIHAACLASIRRHATNEPDWRFTRLDVLPERLGRIAPLDAGERSIVSCFIDAQRWYVMTTARIFGLANGARFSCSPLEVSQWRWGDFKRGGRAEGELVTLALASGTHLRIPYETGPAALAPIGYQRFWTTEYPDLTKPG
jgi:hypothetical protein